MPFPVAGPFAVAPAKGQSGRSAWSEPEPWIVAVLLATGVAVIARHPIARAIGTEVDDSTMTPSVVATAPPAAVSSAAPAAAAAAVEPLPTHAPRDPFHALVAASNAVIGTFGSQVPASSAPVTAGPGQKVAFPGLSTVSTATGQVSAPINLSGSGSAVAAAPAASAPGVTSVAPATPAPAQAKPVTVASAGSCAGTVHTVVRGDSLWTIAAKAVKSSDTARVTVAWHRIYAANTPPLGDNPSLLPVGTKLCIPTTV